MDHIETDPDPQRLATIVAGWDRGQSGTAIQGRRLLHVEHVWTTAVLIDIPDCHGRTAAAQAVIGQCQQFFAEVDRVFSPFRADSMVTAYRHGLLRPGEQTADFAEVMVGCRAARAASAGAFDPWSMPGGYDPLGYVKGWAAGRASRMLTEAGFGEHLVNAGGDVFARGCPPGARSGWEVGVVNPHNPSTTIATAVLRDQAMATSGGYERGAHVLDPSTGVAARAVDSATVIGPDPGMADALASAALVCGRAVVQWFPGLGPQWSVMLVIGQQVLTLGPAFEHVATLSHGK